MRCHLAACVVISFVLSVGVAHAQVTPSSHWGVSVSLTPTWTSPASLKMLYDAQSIDIQGSDFSIGFVRGREDSGDWGVSLVRKTFKDGSFADRSRSESSPFGPGPYPAGLNASATSTVGPIYTTTSSSSLLGLEFHKYWSFVTIKNRFQVGMNLTGGIAETRGQVNASAFDVVYQVRNGQLSSTRTPVSGQVATNKMFIGGVKTIPLGGIDLGVAAIVAPGLKIKAMGGFNFPGYRKFSLGLVYLFGKSK